MNKEIGQVWFNTITGNEVKIVQARPDICTENLILIELVDESGSHWFINECEMPMYIFSGSNKFTDDKDKTKVWSKVYEEYFSGIN